MLTLSSEHPAIRSLRRSLPPLLVGLALAACNGADSPLEPPTVPPRPRASRSRPPARRWGPISRWRPPPGGSCSSHIGAAAATSTGQIGLFNGGSFNYPGFQASYDRSGQKIVYIGSGSKSVEQIKADGTGHKVLVSSTTYAHRPAYSPDWKKVAYSRLISTGDEELFVKNLVDGTTKRMTTSAGDDGSPTWSPDGSRIAFTSRRSGLLQIWTMNAATGGSLMQITHTANAELYPQWSH